MAEDNLNRINLELTSVCNYACVGCPTHILIRGKGFMTVELYKAIFDEIGNKIDRVFLWNYGEPLLHPRICELLRYAGKFSTKKVLSTTGYPLEELKDLESLCELDELILSINGLTPTTYLRHQVNGDFEKVLRGVKKLSPVIKYSKTRFIMQIVAHKENLNDISEAEKFARYYGFDILVVKSFNVMDGEKRTFDRFVPLGTEFSRYSGTLQNGHKIPSKGISPCEESMVINWDGSVNPCCWDYKGEHNLGNVRDLGALGVWRAFSLLSHRKRISNKQFIDICVDCANSKIVRSYSLTDKGGEDDVKKSI